jgi:hypothetical protein
MLRTRHRRVLGVLQDRDARGRYGGGSRRMARFARIWAKLRSREKRPRGQRCQPVQRRAAMTAPRSSGCGAFAGEPGPPERATESRPDQATRGEVRRHFRCGVMAHPAFGMVHSVPASLERGGLPADPMPTRITAALVDQSRPILPGHSRSSTPPASAPWQRRSVHGLPRLPPRCGSQPVGPRVGSDDREQAQATAISAVAAHVIDGLVPHRAVGGQDRDLGDFR